MTRVRTSLAKLCFTGFALTAAGLLTWGVSQQLSQWVQPTPVAAQIIEPIPIPLFPAAWTAIGASGTVDETSIPFFGFTNASAGYGPNASVSPLEFRYNVVNTQHAVSSTGGIPNVPSPGWTRLEFGAQAPGTSIADALLYRVNRCTGQQELICSIRHYQQAAPGTCKTCTFANTTFNFSTYLYYVRVVLDRNTPFETPMAHTLRIY